MVKGGFEQDVPVLLDEREKISSVDVVKFDSVRPVIVDIIDLKTAIRRKISRLNGAKVSAEDRGVGVLLSLVVSNQN